MRTIVEYVAFIEYVKVYLSDGSVAEGWTTQGFEDHVSSDDGIFVLYGASYDPLLARDGVENKTVLIPWDKVLTYCVISDGASAKD